MIITLIIALLSVNLQSGPVQPKMLKFTITGPEIGFRIDAAKIPQQLLYDIPFSTPFQADLNLTHTNVNVPYSIQFLHGAILLLG